MKHAKLLNEDNENKLIQTRHHAGVVQAVTMSASATTA